MESQLSSSEDPDSVKSEIKNLKNKSYKTTYAPISGKVYLEEEGTSSDIASSYMTIDEVVSEISKIIKKTQDELA